jgi:hypothetical protein
MNETKFQKDDAERRAILPKIYSPTFQPLLQSLLATLADIDFEYERERETLSSTSPNTNLKIRALEKLKTRHRERREPYIQQLAVLHRRMMDLRVS